MSQEYIELQLASLAHDGRAVGRDMQRVVFVQGGLPGQRVKARIIKTKKNFAEAECVEILEEAEDFIEPPCSHAKDCGGCPLQSMPYAKQLFWKENMLKEALQRIGKLQHVPFTRMHASPNLWAYRNKMEFAVGYDASGKLILGLRGKGSHEIVATPACLLMPESFKPVLMKVQNLMAATGLKPWQGEKQAQRGQENPDTLWRHVVLRVCDKPFGCHVQLITAPTNGKNRHTIARLGQNLLDAKLGVVGFVHEERHSASLFAMGERCITSLGEKNLTLHLAGMDYALPHGAFFQINTAAAQYICTEAARMADLQGHEILWDVYCGVGAPGLHMAKKAQAVFGVESHKAAIDIAKQNAAHMGMEHCTYVADKAENVLHTWPKPHVVLLDPPRAGMHAKAIESVLKAKPEQIVYISCNPATLARDIAVLCTAYSVESVSAVDLFPHTAHVESCIHLRKA